MLMCHEILDPPRDSDKQTSLRATREMVSSSLHSLTVLTEEDGVPGSKFEREPEEYTVDQLKRWLKCRGLKLRGKREDLVQRVRDSAYPLGKAVYSLQYISLCAGT